MFCNGTRRFLQGIFYFYLLSNSGKIFADTILLRDGKTIENVKTSLRADHVLVVDETGKTEKIDLTLIEKILVSEIKKSEVKEEKKVDTNIKKFYFSLNGSVWSSGVTEKPSFNRGYNLTDIFTMVVNIDPYLEKKYSVNVRTVSFNGEYRRSANFGFSLGLEQNSYFFPNRNISPWVGLLTNVNLNSTPEYQTLSAASVNSFLFNQLSGNFKNDKQGNGKFTLGTLSLLPSVKYYVPLSDSILWFVQGGFGFGKSYENGIYSKPLTQTVFFVGTGIQWESESYFFNVALQYRKTDLKGSVYSYHFNEPIFMIGGGFKL
ncbi:hypothetical protein LEP1GSC060_3607 [Leptospira weilii serovar Ranarum str. ICFT]|uniref:Outer membrane protein beta-barrel domain protein n=1 Tax=Leptospira weilii serovar Ranarum str. ICFT TaxID=1218598 RepID=N1WTP6_9LEPT|nr:hypothetical protein [Leptospira weilii]EMY79238.1 hypothetical protein LEP1GSC060_3607 [Leptospira weilii serovar Ranarum str. ICFT]